MLLFGVVLALQLIGLAATCGKADLKTIVVDGTGVVYSNGYPNQYPTNQNSTGYYDWRIESKNWKKFLVTFDRQSLLKGDVLRFCTVEQYLKCMDQCQCDECVQSIDSFWFPEFGPLIIFFRPFLPDSGSVTRNGFRATIVEVDTNTERYFSCNHTYDISENTGPQYFMSQGFPFLTSMFEQCNIDIIAPEGIRIRVGRYNFADKDSFSLMGVGLDGENTTAIILGFQDIDTALFYYFVGAVRVSFKMVQSNYEVPNMFSFSAEPFNVTTPSCSLNDSVLNHRNTQFDIYSPNMLETFANYPNNMNCTFTLSDVTPNSQIMFELQQLEFEKSADYIKSKELGIHTSEWTGRELFMSAINTTDLDLSIVSDALETSIGVRGRIHIFDCTCTGGTYNLSTQASYGFQMPADISGSGLDRTNTYCRGMQCEWTFNAPQTQNVTVIFTEIDVNNAEYPTLYVGDLFGFPVQAPQKYSFFRPGSIIISFQSFDVFDEVLDNPFPKGFKFEIYAGDQPPTTPSTTPSTTSVMTTSTAKTSTMASNPSSSGSTTTSTTTTTTNTSTTTTTTSTTTTTTTTSTATTTTTQTTTASAVDPTTTKAAETPLYQTVLLIPMIFLAFCY